MKDRGFLAMTLGDWFPNSAIRRIRRLKQKHLEMIRVFLFLGPK